VGFRVRQLPYFVNSAQQRFAHLGLRPERRLCGSTCGGGARRSGASLVELALLVEAATEEAAVLLDELDARRQVRSEKLQPGAGILAESDPDT